MTTLGSVLERDDHADGPRGRLTVDVLEPWLDGGSALEIVVPTRLACARCEGGGCDACAKSGAIRISGAEDLRRVRITLSQSARGLRLTRPLGPDAGLDQLVIELRPAAVASAFCRRVERRAGSKSLAPLVALVVLVALALAVIGALVLRR